MHTAQRGRVRGVTNNDRLVLRRCFEHNDILMTILSLVLPNPRRCPNTLIQASATRILLDYFECSRCSTHYQRGKVLNPTMLGQIMVVARQMPLSHFQSIVVTNIILLTCMCVSYEARTG
jgi:hypothetical protein